MRLLVIAMLLGGCATWTKPNATAEDFRRDEARCVATASEYPARLFYRAVYAGCMERSGWER